MVFTGRRLAQFWRLSTLGLALILGIISAGPAIAASGADFAVAGGWFFTETGGSGGLGYAVRDAGTDSSGHPIRFWTEFRRLGGVATLGYPVGSPYVGADGFRYQPFQRGVLQWRPELGRAFLTNTFEILHSANRDAWLLNVKGVPQAIADDGSNGNYQAAVTTRLGWLTNSAIKAKFLANPNPSSITGWNLDRAIELYGLPMSRPEQHGPFISQRFQRISFQLWTANVSGMPTPGTVVGILGGDLLKEAGQIPGSSTRPTSPNGTPSSNPTPTPAPTPPPAANYAWHSTYVQGTENCGTTYIRAFARDANGNGVNGMTIKSWNDYGNVYIASTKSQNGSDGYWDRVIGSGVREGTWYLELVDGNLNQASNVVTVHFTGSCVKGQGNVQEVEVEFRPS